MIYKSFIEIQIKHKGNHSVGGDGEASLLPPFVEQNK
jgi:hypothetical protein